MSKQANTTERIADLQTSTTEYEILAQKADPMYPEMLRATETVKRFIAERNCVIYGGTAIDYALRLRGSAIYSDEALTIPDLDFYSTKSADDAADLADILFADGHKDARSIQAIHVQTTKVDAGANHWIADISFVPHSVMERIPTVVYMGMRCTHPDFQRIDLHSSLTYPYDNAPSEVVFARWGKDTERLRKIDEIYPIAPKESASEIELPTPADRTKRTDLPLAGWGAYSAMIAACVRQGAVLNNKSGDLAAAFSIDKDAFKWSAPPGNTRAEYYCEDIKPTHAGYISIKPPREETSDVILYSTADRLLSVVSIPQPDNTSILSVCANGVLMYMLAEHIINCCPHALAAYRTLWKLANSGKYSFLDLSANVYGTRNINDSQKIAMRRIAGEQVSDDVPASYVPSRGKPRKPFDYVADLWKQDGRKLRES